MKHSIRQYILDPVTGLKVTKVETVNGELGSGIFDKNKREIFEGDIVRLEDARFPIEFRDGCFHVGNAYLLWRFSCIRGALEVVGHVAEVKTK